MGVTGIEKVDKTINWWIIITLVTQLVWFVWMIAMLEARVTYLENFANRGDRFTTTDWKILEARIETRATYFEEKLSYYSAGLEEIRADIKEIKADVKELNKK